MDSKNVQHSFKEELLRVQLEIQEDIFRTISLQLHDNVGQQLSLSKLYLHSIENGLKEETREKVEVVRQVITGCIDDIRELAGIFSPETVRQAGLAGSLRRQVSMIRKTGHLQVELDIQEKIPEPGYETTIVLFRMIQQCLFDVLTNALATKVTIRMWTTEGNWCAELWDNRKKERHQSIHYSGSLTKKAKLIGAILRSKYEQGRGACINICLPLNKKEHDKDSLGR